MIICRAYKKSIFSKCCTFPFFTVVCLAGLIITSCKNKQQVHNENNAVIEIEKKESGRGKYKFTMKLNPGTKYYYTLINETNMQLEVEGKKINNTNISTIGLIYELAKVNADTMVIKATYDKFHIVLVAGDEKQEIDADNAAVSQDGVEKVLSSIKGSSLLITMAGKGKIVNVSGTKEIETKVLSNLGIYDDPNTKMQVQAQLHKMIGDDFIKNNIGQVFNLYPDSAIAVGYTWKTKNVQSGELSFQATTTCTLASVNDNTAEIETTSVINTSDSPAEIMGQKVNADIKGEAEGKLEVDVQTGMPVLAKSKTTLEGSIQVMTKSVPVEMTIKKSLTVKRL